jgi:RhtB (resistance to homoserine/threonine) family protein
MVVQLLAFVGVSLIIICTPGPDTALTIRNTLAGGRRAGVLTAAGVAIGQLVWTVAAALGIATVLQASQPVFETLRWLGAAYLVALGIQSLRSSWRKGPVDRTAGHDTLPRAPYAALRQGLFSNLANPKMAAFFLSLLPQFVPAGMHGPLPLLGLGLLFCLLTLAWLSCYALALHRAHVVLRRSRVRRTLDALTGTVLIGIGVRLAVEKA